MIGGFIGFHAFIIEIQGSRSKIFRLVHGRDRPSVALHEIVLPSV
jgi:hypothetical protein